MSSFPRYCFYREGRMGEDREASEGSLSVVDDFTGLDLRRDDGSDTIVISRPLPGRTGGIHDLHIP